MQPVGIEPTTNRLSAAAALRRRSRESEPITGYATPPPKNDQNGTNAPGASSRIFFQSADVKSSLPFVGKNSPMMRSHSAP